MSVIKQEPNKLLSSATLIVSFSGQGLGFGTLPRFEFVNFLNKHYPDTNKHFYLDKHSGWYHQGIDGISSNVDETLAYLRKEIAPYKRVVFLGSSAGGYAAILFGSLLHVDIVIAFKPQTYLTSSEKTTDPRYMNLKEVVTTQNTATWYYIYGDPTVSNNIDPFHHISHCENIAAHPNVTIVPIPGLDLQRLRDQGGLLKIFESILFESALVSGC